MPIVDFDYDGTRRPVPPPAPPQVLHSEDKDDSLVWDTGRQSTGWDKHEHRRILNELQQNNIHLTAELDKCYNHIEKLETELKHYKKLDELFD